MKGLPRVHVGMMIKLGHDNLIARLERTPQGARRVECQRRSIGAKHNLRRCRAKEVSHCRAGLMDYLVCFSACRKIPVRICVMAEKVVGHCVDDAARCLCTAWSV